MSKLVTALFKSPESVDLVIEQIVRKGIPQEDISVLLSETTRGREFAVAASTKAPEGATAGAAAGGVLGAVGAALVAAGTVTVPGLNLLAAGPIVAALAGAGAGGTAGGLLGALVGAGIPEHEAKFYSGRLSDGGILVGVYVHDDRVASVKDILKASGGESIKTES